MLKGKRLTGTMAMMVVIALVISATYAWTNFNTSVANGWEGLGLGIPGGVLHDDVYNEYDKDVYVENIGSVPIFARIRLDEYMELKAGAADAYSLVAGGVRGDKDTWLHHEYESIDSPQFSAAGFNSYWRWYLGGQKYYKPTPNGKPFGYIDQETPYGYGPSSDPNAKQTLDATVITIEKWQENGKKPGDYWVTDKDGWCYWASPLEPKTATGLLIDKVELFNTPEHDYYYAINIIAQFATKDGVDAEGNPDNYLSFGDDKHGNWTKDGQELMDIITGTAPSGGYIYVIGNGDFMVNLSRPSENGWINLKQGESLSLSAQLQSPFMAGFSVLQREGYQIAHTPTSAYYSVGESVPVGDIFELTITKHDGNGVATGESVTLTIVVGPKTAE
jgi:hypothetical protein